MPYVVGAASTLVTALIVQLVVQFWVVPRVETRKRREDRWERDVRDLHGLLAMRLPSVASDALTAQVLYREARDDRTSRNGPEQIQRRKMTAEKAGLAYRGLVRSEMDMLIDHVVSIKCDAPDLAKLEKLYKAYQERVTLVRTFPDEDRRADAEFGETWIMEDEARTALTAQVKLLANMRHPPR